ncbi:MAG: MBL fold metallo-hydrolase [Hespellia sp.]|nr:MBL fold metallo-hydrolase [Hespellia sp.]
MKIISLIENQVRNEYLEQLHSEHGLSVWIWYQGKNYLLDTGSTNLFAENAEAMGLNLEDVDTAFLSHAHYDHSGGFAEFFALNQKAKVYLRKESVEGCYSQRGEKNRYIGIPEGLLKDYPDRFIFTDSQIEVEKGIWLIPHTTENLEERARHNHMIRKKEQGYKTDDFMHEQSLVFEGEKGLVILNSCCHAGVDNVIMEVQKALPGRNIDVMIGGFHLMGASGAETMGYTREEVEKLGNTLMALPVNRIYTGHCTGLPAYRILKEMMPEKLDYFSSGTSIEC